MHKILEKIYLEKNVNTNISIFFASLTALFIYLVFKDVTLTVIAFIGIFSLTKVLSRYISNSLFKQKDFRRQFSNSEIVVIKIFIQKGTCFIRSGDYPETPVGYDGLDSLVSRDFIEVVDGVFNHGISGFKLDNKVYKAFL